MLKINEYGSKVTWDCWTDETRKSAVQLTDGIETNLCEQDLFGAGIRCFCAGKMGFAATTQKNDLENTLRLAHELSQFGPDEDLQQDGRVQRNHREGSQNKCNKIEQNHHYIDAIHKLLHKRRDTKCAVEFVSQKVKYQNHYGRVLSAQRHFCDTVLTRTLPEEGKSIKLKIFFSSLSENGNSLKESSALLFSPLPVVSSPKTCEADCLFIEQASIMLLRMLSRNLILLFITLAQPEMYESLLENLSLSGLVNLTDAPDEKLGFTFDGEGRRCKKVSVMQAGRLVSAIFDTKLAARVGMQATGNAMRRYDTPPYLDFRTLILENGNRSYESILREKTGVLIIEMKDTLLNANFGEYKLEIIHGVQIKNGKAVGRLLGGHIVINIMNIFGKNLLELGKEQYRNLRVNSAPICAAKVRFV